MSNPTEMTPIVLYGNEGPLELDHIVMPTVTEVPATPAESAAVAPETAETTDEAETDSQEPSEAESAAVEPETAEANWWAEPDSREPGEAEKAAPKRGPAKP